MTIRNDRSMNADLARGAVDGKMRFLRPDAGGPADEMHAEERRTLLHEPYHGTTGNSQDYLGTIKAAGPTATPAYPPYLGGGTDYGM